MPFSVSRAAKSWLPVTLAPTRTSISKTLGENLTPSFMAMASILLQNGNTHTPAVDHFFRRAGRVAGVSAAIGEKLAPLYRPQGRIERMGFPHLPVPGRAPFDFLYLQLVHGRIPGRPHGLARFRAGNGEAPGLGKIEGVPHPLLQLAHGLRIRQPLRERFPTHLPGEVVALPHLDQLRLEHLKGGAVLDDEIARVGSQLGIKG